MASYPTAPKTFTTKNAGDTIQPAHVNDLQDEVNAIEDGLLNAKAPLNSSNSTVANLSVTGKSTMAGAVQMDGNCTIAGTLTVGTIVSTSIGAGGGGQVDVYVGSTWHTASSTTFTVVPLDQKVRDKSSEWDSTTYTFQAASSGIYLVTGHLYASGGTDGGNKWAILQNSTVVVEFRDDRSGTSPAYTRNISEVMRLDTVSTSAIQFGLRGLTSGIQGTTGITVSRIQIVKLF